MKVKAQDIEALMRFISIMEAEYDYTVTPAYCSAEAHVVRTAVYNIQINAEANTLELDGHCAWSVASCMLYEGRYFTEKSRKGAKITCLENLSNELNLEVEVFSCEEGNGLAEHYLIKNGRFKICDVQDLPLVGSENNLRFGKSPFYHMEFQI